MRNARVVVVWRQKRKQDGGPDIAFGAGQWARSSRQISFQLEGDDGVGDGHQAAAQGVPGAAEEPGGEHPRGAAGEEHPGVALRDLRHGGLALRGGLLPRQAQVPARVPHEAPGRHYVHAQRPLRDRPPHLPQHVGLPPGDVEPALGRRLHPHGALLLHETSVRGGVSAVQLQGQELPRAVHGLGGAAARQGEGAGRGFRHHRRVRGRCHRGAGLDDVALPTCTSQGSHTLPWYVSIPPFSPQLPQSFRAASLAQTIPSNATRVSVEVTSTMASVMATKRLRKEYLAMQRKPVDYIQAVPVESNILEWHYVITGTKGSPYEGGFYHGKLKFPPEYPMKPPSVMMITPNGRFKTNQRLCLSMSDFHPETWNPMWSVSSILTGLYSFMLENQATLGSISTTDAQKRKYAAASLETQLQQRDLPETVPRPGGAAGGEREGPGAAAPAFPRGGGRSLGAK
ncbi:hypothetical protein ON010_g4214 [Phytophthora cinnamomi]|nr:hypothetical protein ON010_g4214 [Phytophthora cinnamomi]